MNRTITTLERTNATRIRCIRIPFSSRSGKIDRKCLFFIQDPPDAERYSCIQGDKILFCYRFVPIFLYVFLYVQVTRAEPKTVLADRFQIEMAQNRIACHSYNTRASFLKFHKPSSRQLHYHPLFTVYALVLSVVSAVSFVSSFLFLSLRTLSIDAPDIYPSSRFTANNRSLLSTRVPLSTTRRPTRLHVNNMCQDNRPRFATSTWCTSRTVNI